MKLESEEDIGLCKERQGQSKAEKNKGMLVEDFELVAVLEVGVKTALSSMMQTLDWGVKRLQILEPAEEETISRILALLVITLWSPKVGVQPET